MVNFKYIDNNNKIAHYALNSLGCSSKIRQWWSTSLKILQKGCNFKNNYTKRRRESSNFFHVMRSQTNGKFK